MKKIVFIGNRSKVFEVISSNKKVKLVHAFVIEQPLIEDKSLCEITRLDSKGQKEELINALNSLEYDICISAGCTYVLPMTKLPQNKIFINCHPSVLPFGKGMHPLNECFLSGNNIAGVTIHILVDELDAGDILNQIQFDLTDEIDVSVLYSFIFDLEAELLEETLNRILDSNMNYKAMPQKGIGTYYSREKERRKFFSEKVSVEELFRNVRAFSANNLGVELLVNELRIIVYSMQKIENKFIIDRYKNIEIGSLIFKNEDIVLVKLKNGIAKINKFKFYN
jgi:methionyl-tRNA formyltransferase